MTPITTKPITSASGGAVDSVVTSFERVLSQALRKVPSQHPPPNQIPVSTSLIEALQRAQLLQTQRGDFHIAVDHLILSILKNTQIWDCFMETDISDSGVRSEVEKLRGQALKTFGRDVVEQARTLDQVIGRDEEIQYVIHILSQRIKNNPVLIGEARVDKTAVVEGLAQRITRHDVPSNLAYKRLISLDMGALIAGAMFEKILMAIPKEVEVAAGKVVLFIDEIHLVLGAGKTEVPWMLPTCLNQCLQGGRCDALELQHWKSTGSMLKKMQPSREDSNKFMWLSPVLQTLFAFSEG